MTWAIWWPVGVMAAVMLADVVAVLVSARLQMAIERGRARLIAAIEDEKVQQGLRLAEIRRAISLSDSAGRACRDAAEEMRRADAQLKDTLAEVERQRAAWPGNVVQLRVTTPDPGCSLPPVGREG